MFKTLSTYVTLCMIPLHIVNAADTATINLAGTFSPSPCTVTPSATTIILNDVRYNDIPSKSSSLFFNEIDVSNSTFSIVYKCAAATSAGIRIKSPSRAGWVSANVVKGVSDQWAFPVYIQGNPVPIAGLGLSTFIPATILVAATNINPPAAIVTFGDYSDVTKPHIPKAVITEAGITHVIRPKLYGFKENFDPSKETLLNARIEIELFY